MLTSENIMNAFQGILSLQEAMNSDVMTTPSLNPQHLELENLQPHTTKIPVSDNLPRYRQPLLYDGCRLTIQAPAVDLRAVFYKQSNAGDSVLVPVTNWLQHQFSILDMFVCENVTVPHELRQQWSFQTDDLYTPIYKGRNICIQLSRFCRFTQSVNGQFTDLPCQPRPKFGVGRYTYTIEVPNVYIGPHKSGHLISLNMFVSRIHFEAAPLRMTQSFVQQPLSQTYAPQSVPQPVSYCTSVYVSGCTSTYVS